ncbi:TetR/AcrR family transcriptional regulator [[Mycobacterium] crassicus]|uniref:TetR/AcrR family transcriptional regulator n=1 Tax=[Mycobacterium] crassicus TaxID=2872309 RepID=A0ABU5XH82_9MYCO|nr:TetR/AcrR family transcriptional regulator [Mycolicibacter sp. MYC098]MEB3021653.1 TetR/AcrR family transcriptional regulator [Mycolicibacter sp. MYC098]
MTRTGYHHGDLRAALIESGLQLTQVGGPEALTIREATRRAGVSPNAAYRHFADREALLRAVASAIQDRMAARMLEPATTRSSAQSRARSQLRTVGLGYIEFALDEPGWFAVAFFGGSDLSTLNGDGVAPPFRALVDALDAMVDTGALQPDQRIGAEWPCWAAVHGFAELALHGPLRGTPRHDLEALAQRTVDCIIAGLAQ